VTCALTAVDVKDCASHEAGRLQIEDRADDVGNVAHMADWCRASSCACVSTGCIGDLITPGATAFTQILSNPEMIQAYKAGIPANGKTFPDGFKIVKLAWSQKKITDWPPLLGEHAGHGGGFPEVGSQKRFRRNEPPAGTMCSLSDWPPHVSLPRTANLRNPGIPRRGFAVSGLV
jgi:hypothetical protein